MGDIKQLTEGFIRLRTREFQEALLELGFKIENPILFEGITSVCIVVEIKDGAEEPGEFKKRIKTAIVSCKCVPVLCTFSFAYPVIPNVFMNLKESTECTLNTVSFIVYFYGLR
jgi:hypothetical protein